jgi:nuclear pore complex protein Nup188
VSIIKKIVAEGFRALVAGIHEKPADSVADDIALVTAILQACLRFPGVEMCYTQILDAMASCDTIRVAITLYSWSDKLAIEGDPIYGELSVLFLLELSSIPVIAEQLAVEGTLGHISNANITSYIRDGKATALAEGFGPQRCYRLWVRGILPLVLNILTAVGATIATEVSLFMSQFPKVLEQSVNAIEPPPTSFGRTASPARVTYNMVSEVHTTALILYALNMFRLTMAGISEIREIKRDHASVLDSVEHWLTERMVLRERILPIGFREMEMAKQKPLSAGTGSENRLEEKVVQELMGIKAILTGGDV